MSALGVALVVAGVVGLVHGAVVRSAQTFSARWWMGCAVFGAGYLLFFFGLSTTQERAGWAAAGLTLLVALALVAAGVGVSVALRRHRAKARR